LWASDARYVAVLAYAAGTSIEVSPAFVVGVVGIVGIVGMVGIVGIVSVSVSEVRIDISEVRIDVSRSTIQAFTGSGGRAE
jgi:hypothetical protein